MVFSPVILFSVISFVYNAEATSENNVFKVALSKQHVPVMSDGKQVAVKTAYYGDINVGGPVSQYFTVVFDTGSGHLFIPSHKCKDLACQKHRRYFINQSATAIELNHDGSSPTVKRRDQVSIAYGTGDIRGEFVQETVCLGLDSATMLADEKMPQSCARARVILAQKMTDDPFGAFEFDGVLGLGLRSLALDPEFHVFGQIAKSHHIEPIFSFFISMLDEDKSEITFGGFDEKRMTTPLQYVPVQDPDQGFWRVPIKGVRLGDEVLEMCTDGSCSAIVDTGTSLLGVPNGAYNTLILGTARQLTDDLAVAARQLQAASALSSSYAGELEGGVDCRYVPGPNITFDMGHFQVVLEAEDYSRPVLTKVVGFNSSEPDTPHSVCRASLLPIDMPALGTTVFVWGEPVLKKYYTSYDLEGERVGFSRAQHSKKTAAVARAAYLRGGVEV